jgi:hypothetical protein
MDSLEDVPLFVLAHQPHATAIDVQCHHLPDGMA